MRKDKLIAVIVGVILLGTILFVVGGKIGIWTEKSGYQSEKRKIKDIPQLEIKKLMGTMLIKPTIKKFENASNYWIYVNGRIVFKKVSPKDDQSSLDPLEILLVPGEYTVEVAVNALSSLTAYDFPIYFRTQQVVIEAGKVAEVEIDVEGARPRWVGYPSLSYKNKTWVELLEIMEDSFKNSTEECQKDPVLLAINEVYRALQQSPPLLSVVYVDMPDYCGNGREFDAQQIRLIVDWLKEKHWRWLPSSNNKPKNRMPGYLSYRYNQIMSKVSSYIRDIDHYKKIARKLDAAGR